MKRAVMTAVLTMSVVMGAAAAARAEDGQMRLRVAGLNLQSAEGAQVAANRIRRQVEAFCQANEGPRSLEVTAEVNRCVAEMSRKTLAQLNAPLVTARFENRAAPPEKAIAVAER